MADLNYLFSQTFGFEPYKDNSGAGGATLTGHNLVVTTWAVIAKGPDGVYTGSLLRPVSENENVLPQKRVGGTQAVNSRYSARMRFQWDGSTKPVPITTDTVLFALNPPPELRQQLVRAVAFNGGDPADLNNFTVRRSLQLQNTWEIDLHTSNGYDCIYIPTLDFDALWSTMLDLGAYNGSPGLFLPLLRSNGANGQMPQGFDMTTAQGVNEMLATVNAGDFYVGLIVGADWNDNHMWCEIRFPHSAARG
jgi:hypothetical protein